MQLHRRRANHVNRTRLLLQAAYLKQIACVMLDFPPDRLCLTICVLHALQALSSKCQEIIIAKIVIQEHIQ